MRKSKLYQVWRAGGLVNGLIFMSILFSLGCEKLPSFGEEKIPNPNEIAPVPLQKTSDWIGLMLSHSSQLEDMAVVWEGTKGVDTVSCNETWKVYRFVSNGEKYVKYGVWIDYRIYTLNDEIKVVQVYLAGEDYKLEGYLDEAPKLWKEKCKEIKFQQDENKKEKPKGYYQCDGYRVALIYEFEQTLLSQKPKVITEDDEFIPYINEDYLELKRIPNTKVKIISGDTPKSYLYFYVEEEDLLEIIDKCPHPYGRDDE